jgi:hypothetical protein
MQQSRRDFLDRLALGAATLAALPIPLPLAAAPAPDGKWDLSWVQRIAGKHRVVLDVPEIDNAYGVWRASIWASQYQEVLGAQPRDLSTVLVLRHNAIFLAMREAFWQQYGVGKAKGAMHPVSRTATDRNPALLADVPAPFDALALDKLIARGGIVLACNLAFDEPIEMINAKDGLGDEAARARAIEMHVPGVTLQPSGIFAVIRAQEAGCLYVRAS